MTKNSQGYVNPLPESKSCAPVEARQVITDECVEMSLLSKLNGNSLLNAKQLANNSDGITYRTVEDNDDVDEMDFIGEYQVNSRDEGVNIQFGRRNFKMCGRYRGQQKIAIENWQMMQDTENGYSGAEIKDLIVSAVHRGLDIRRDRVGIIKLLASVPAYNRGNKNRYNLNFGDDASPVNATDGKILTSLFNGMASASEQSRPCDKTSDAIFVCRPEDAALLRQYQGDKNCCNTVAETGMLQDAYGHSILVTNKLPTKNVNGNLVHPILLVNKSQIGALLYNHYLKFEELGHDMLISWLFKYDAHVINQDTLVAANVVTKPVDIPLIEA